MISLWPHWQRPLFIIVLPLFIYLLWKLWNTHQIKGSWKKVIPERFQPWLLSGISSKESTLPKLLISLASILALIALLGPSWKNIKQAPLKTNAPLVVVMDMTPRMLSTDIAPNRLESAKHKLMDIINSRKDAQTAIVAYAGSAHTVAPLSDDNATLDNLIKSLNPSIMPKQGERADLAIAKAIQLIDNTQQNTGNKQGEILLITSSLSEQEQDNIKKLLANKSLTLSILGVGTAQGAPISIGGSFLKDRTGKIIIPKLDNTNLQALAYNEGGYYSNITLDNSDIDTLHLTHLDKNIRHIDDTEAFATQHWQDQGYWFILPLLIIAAFAGRKGWLFCVPLLFISFQPQTAHAFEWQSLLLNKNQQGQKLLKENKPNEATKLFSDKEWQGYAAYEAKNYQQAEEKFSKLNTPEGIYNYGNSLARQAKYQEAIEQWDKAIELKPNFEQAIVNKKIVEDLLKQKQPEQEQSNQQKQDQDQNKDQQQQQSSQQQDDQSQSQSNQQQQNADQQKDNKQQKEADEQKTSDLQQQNQTEKQTAEKDKTAQLEEVQKKEDNPSDDASKNQTMDAMEIQQQEQEETFKQQIREIPDNPSELLRRKFYYEQRYNKGNY